MIPFHSHSRRLSPVLPAGIRPVATAVALALAACSPRVAEQAQEKEVPPEEYHADYDIAMALASIADAIRVGEPLDTADYNFVGVLTDGQGHPLYTDTRGTPGKWDVDVITSTSAVARNVDLGDLLPEDLRSYLGESFNLGEEDIVDASRYDEGDEEMEMVVYDISGAYLRIETRRGVSPSGLEGPLMRITVSRDLPQHPTAGA